MVSNEETGGPRREGPPVGVVKDKAHSSYEINRDRFSPIPKLTDCPERVVISGRKYVGFQKAQVRYSVGMSGHYPIVIIADQQDCVGQLGS